MNQKIRCANPACRRLFLPDPHVKNHRFCSKNDCQRFRKRQWQRQKMKNDSDYQDDKRAAQQSWVEQNRDYQRRYRDQHPEYVKRNRFLQRERDRRRRLRNLAKMDASNQISLVKPGSYYLISAKEDLAKMDSSSKQYVLIPNLYPFLAKMDSMDFLNAFPQD